MFYFLFLCNFFILFEKKYVLIKFSCLSILLNYLSNGYNSVSSIQQSDCSMGILLLHKNAYFSFFYSEKRESQFNKKEQLNIGVFHCHKCPQLVKTMMQKGEREKKIKNKLLKFTIENIVSAKLRILFSIHKE